MKITKRQKDAIKMMHNIISELKNGKRIEHYDGIYFIKNKTILGVLHYGILRYNTMAINEVLMDEIIEYYGCENGINFENIENIPITPMSEQEENDYWNEFNHPDNKLIFNN